VTLTSGKDSLFGPAGTQLKAHEFHYWDSTENGDGFEAVKPNGRRWTCGILTDTMYAGYPHLYLPSNIGAAASFYCRCLDYKEKKNDYRETGRD
jgi:cobyrinic acid a,c-diamide synthase